MFAREHVGRLAPYKIYCSREHVGRLAPYKIYCSREHVGRLAPCFLDNTTYHTTQKC